MIILCPHCGRKLTFPITDGLTFCYNCKQASDSSSKNKILSAAWEIRRKGYLSAALQELLSEKEREIINDFEDKLFCHDDLLKELSDW